MQFDAIDNELVEVITAIDGSFVVIESSLPLFDVTAMNVSCPYVDWSQNTMLQVSCLVLGVKQIICIQMVIDQSVLASHMFSRLCPQFKKKKKNLYRIGTDTVYFCLNYTDAT